MASTGGEVTSRRGAERRGTFLLDPGRDRRPCPDGEPQRGLRPDHRRSTSRRWRPGDALGLDAEPGAPRRSATRSTPRRSCGLTIETDDSGEVFWGIVHSHTHSPAIPSATDLRLAFYPEPCTCWCPSTRRRPIRPPAPNPCEPGGSSTASATRWPSPWSTDRRPAAPGLVHARRLICLNRRL